MKRRLNLFTQRTSSQKVRSYYVIARRISLIFFGILVLVVMGLGGAFFYLNQQLRSIEQDTLGYSRFILGNESFSIQIQEFVYKYKLLRNFLQDDAESYKYYTALVDFTNRTNSQESILSFSIDNSQNVEFTLRFPTYSDAITFVEELESPMVYEYFSVIELQGLDLSDTTQDSYQLSLSGVLVPIDEDES